MRIFGFLAISVLAGCVAEPDVSGQQLFTDNCAACHGITGIGDGVAAPALSVTPPDLTGLTARNSGVFPRDYVMSTIDGYSRGTHFAPDMPAFGEGDLGDVVIVENPDGTGTPIPLDLIALADYLESIQR
ncbi:c-type cytochrome [Flavimaricola marinus]|uniref:Cytochrome c n=1 Tax=Flavimaricola marinus TaxID=1819565 RepID=A0A238LHS1_9RHOB|nr:cytochrome c [Flavimaricola marinus]SMY08506.1 Cytochrome c [Flavimaricola marinus]